jgi:hypothetical protein
MKMSVHTLGKPHKLYGSVLHPLSEPLSHPSYDNKRNKRHRHVTLALLVMSACLVAVGGGMYANMNTYKSELFCNVSGDIRDVSSDSFAIAPVLYCGGHSFIDCFDFSTFPDPTHGTTDYIGRREAVASGLYNVTQAGSVYIGADSHHVPKTRSLGRKSIRLKSKQSFSSGLFLIDLEHMPAGCGMWPALWLVGPHWCVVKFQTLLCVFVVIVLR